MAIPPFACCELFNSPGNIPRRSDLEIGGDPYFGTAGYLFWERTRDSLLPSSFGRQWGRGVGSDSARIRKSRSVSKVPPDPVAIAPGTDTNVAPLARYAVTYFAFMRFD